MRVLLYRPKDRFAAGAANTRSALLILSQCSAGLRLARTSARTVPNSIVNKATSADAVWISIRFESHCEHHMAPIIGRVHIVVDVYAKRLQVQEKMTAEIAKLSEQRLEAAWSRRGGRGWARMPMLRRS